MAWKACRLGPVSTHQGSLPLKKTPKHLQVTKGICFNGVASPSASTPFPDILSDGQRRSQQMKGVRSSREHASSPSQLWMLQSLFLPTKHIVLQESMRVFPPKEKRCGRGTTFSTWSICKRESKRSDRARGERKRQEGQESKREWVEKWRTTYKGGKNSSRGEGSQWQLLSLMQRLFHTPIETSIQWTQTIWQKLMNLAWHHPDEQIPILQMGDWEAQGSEVTWWMLPVPRRELKSPNSYSPALTIGNTASLSKMAWNEVKERDIKVKREREELDRRREK